MKDERLASKVEGKTNFSMRLKQFDGLTRLTVTLSYFTTDLRLWVPLPQLEIQSCGVLFCHVNVRLVVR